MVILKTRNKITDFLMILAWASPFKGFKGWVAAFILVFNLMASLLQTNSQKSDHKAEI